MIRRGALAFLTHLLVGVMLALSAAGLLGGRQARLGPELDVIDLVPRDVDVGDRIEVLGTNLPSGEGRTAVVIFSGELRRPGQQPLLDQEVRIEEAQLSTDK